MDAIRLQIQRVLQQLAGLSPSQKMLAVALVLVAVLTLYSWSRYASERALTPVFSANLPAEQMTQITAALDSAGVAYEISGGQLMVPKDKAMLAWSQASYLGVLPDNSTSSFDQLLENVRPWESTGVLHERFKRGRELMLSQMMSSWPGVSRAEVFVDPRDKAGIGIRHEPSATVNIQTRRSDGGRQLAETAADAVVGTVSGLRRSRVTVIVDRTTYPIRDRDMNGVGGASEIIELVRSHEQRVEEKIRAHFGFIPGLHVAVTAQVNTTTRQQTRRTPDPQSKVSVARSEETETSEDEGGGGASEPGAVPNIGLDAGTATAEGNRSLQERNRTEFMTDIGVTQTTESTPAGDATIVIASVRMPRSYFIETWKRQASPTGSEATPEPTPEELANWVEAELANIRADVRNLTNVELESMVTVGVYTDLQPIAYGEGATNNAGMGGGVTSLASGYAKELAIGGLAAVSLFMVTRLVKRSAPPPPVKRVAVATSSSPRGPVDLANEDAQVAGVAPPGLELLLGQELDPESLEARQMVEQVSTLVKENPDMAAQLIRRWLNRH